MKSRQSTDLELSGEGKKIPIMPSETEKTLKSVKIFAGIDEAALAELAEKCRWETVEPEVQVITHQDSSNDVTFVIEGKARVIIYSLAGKTVTFRDIDAGDFVGELSAIDGAPRSASVEAVEKCLVAHMPSKVFLEAITTNSTITEAALLHFTNQIRTLTERVFEFSTLAVRNRIQAELLRLTDFKTEADGTARLSPAPTHAEIASRVSTHREAVTRELQRLTQLGLIERQGRSLHITDVAQLELMVQEVIGN